jgi:hypothetical protein
MTTYFDAVLDEHMKPLCNGTQEEVLAWLEERRNDWRKGDQSIEDKQVRVCIGKTMQLVTVGEYIDQFG